MPLGMVPPHPDWDASSESVWTSAETWGWAREHPAGECVVARCHHCRRHYGLKHLVFGSVGWHMVGPGLLFDGGGLQTPSRGARGLVSDHGLQSAKFATFPSPCSFHGRFSQSYPQHMSLCSHLGMGLTGTQIIGRNCRPQDRSFSPCRFSNEQQVITLSCPLGRKTADIQGKASTFEMQSKSIFQALSFVSRETVNGPQRAVP